MKLKVNGKEQSFDAERINVQDLLKLSNVADPAMVSVQINGEFVAKENYESAALKDGDEVDFLYFMGGGAAGEQFMAIVHYQINL